MFWKYSWTHFFLLKKYFLHVKLHANQPSAKKLLSFNVVPLSIVSVFFQIFSTYNRKIAIAWNSIDFILAIPSCWYFVLYSSGVYMYFAMFTWADELRATKLSRLKFISCTYKIIAFSVECCLRYFIKRAGKSPVFEWPINVSNDKRSELRFFSKSLFSNKNYV